MANQMSIDIYENSEKHKRRAWFSFRAKDDGNFYRCTVVADHYKTHHFNVLDLDDAFIYMQVHLQSWRVEREL